MWLVVWAIVIFVALELAFLGILYVVYALEERATRGAAPLTLNHPPTPVHRHNGAQRREAA